MKTKIFIPTIIVCVFLVIAIFRLPYGYYKLLRVIVTGIAIYFCYLNYEINRLLWIWIMGIIALVFNPLIPFYLGKEVWIIFDLGASAVFGIHYFLSDNNK